MAKVQSKFLEEYSIGTLRDVDYGRSVPANNTTLLFDDITETWKPKKTGQLSALKRVITEDFLVEEDEFVIIVRPKIAHGVIFKVEGELKVVS